VEFRPRRVLKYRARFTFKGLGRGSFKAPIFSTGQTIRKGEERRKHDHGIRLVKAKEGFTGQGPAIIEGINAPPFA